MKARPYKIVDGCEIECSPQEATLIKIKVPCPVKHRSIPVILNGQRSGTPCWTWNGDVDRPTLMPSVRTSYYKPSGEYICHSWITDGRVQFLTDSTHANAGKTLDLMEV